MGTLDFTFERRIELERRDARLEGDACGEDRGEARGRTKDILIFYFWRGTHYG